MKEHSEWVNDTCAEERCKHVSRDIIDVVCLSVVDVEKYLNMFPRSLKGVGVGKRFSIDEADSMIYCVVRVTLAWKK